MRYRAAACPPPGEKLCAFCGSSRHVEIHHADGHEEHTERANLLWACRRCNTRIGVVMKRLGLGRRTVQSNPPAQGARNLAQWLTAVLSMKGQSSAMSVPEAVAMIRATPAEDRSGFASQIWERRRQHYPECGRSRCAADEV